jgi:uncharacterized membrane protein YfcA
MDLALGLQMMGWGFLSGLMGGLFGIGGGVILVNIFPFYLRSIGVPVPDLIPFNVSNSLFVTFFSTLSANFRNWKKGTLEWMPILKISFAGVLTGLLLLHFFVNTPYFRRFYFDALFLSLLGFMAIRFFARRNSEPITDMANPLRAVTPWKWRFAGILSGAISPLTGMGGGILLVPILHDRFRLPMQQAQSISLGTISFTTLATAAYSVLQTPAVTSIEGQWGLLILPLSLPAALGGMIGAQAGLHLSGFLNQKQSRILFALLLVILVALRLYPS